MDTPQANSVYDTITGRCMAAYTEPGKSAYALLEELMGLPDVPMHSPVHHYMLPAALLAVCRREQGQPAELLQKNLREAQKRATNILPGFCGFYGACGAGVGLGLFWSIITGSGPKAVESWGWANAATGGALCAIAAYGGPRCCKRVSFVALQSGAPAILQHLGVDIGMPDAIRCRHFASNAECLHGRCPFFGQATA